MKAQIGRYVGLSAFLVGLVLLATPVVGAARTNVTTYTVTFFEVGLGTGVGWSVTFNSVTYSSSGTSLNVTGLSAGSYYWSTSATVSTSKTTVEYSTGTTGAYMTVPNQKSQFIPYVKEYQVTTTVTPAGFGTVSPTTGFYPAGSEFTLQSYAYWGYQFSSWKSSSGSVTLDSATSSSTVVTVNASATITAKFAVQKSAVTFSEVGLPTSTSWSAVFSGTSYPGTTSSIKIGSQGTGYYYYSIPTVLGTKGVEYVPTPSSGAISVPAQLSQEIVFTKEFKVYFATNPSSSGSLNMYSPIYVPNGTQVAVDAYNTGGFGFVSWSSNSTAIGIGSKTTASTNASIGGTGGLTAKFTGATACSKNCTLTFTEMGLPTGTNWGLTLNGQTYSSSTSTITLKKLNSGVSWSALSPVGSSSTSAYYVSAYSSSGYLYLGYSNAQVVVFNHEYYVNIVSNPLYAGTGETQYSGWYPAGSTQPLSAISTALWTFSSYSSSSSSLPLSSKKTASTSFVVNGPGTITANFKNPKATFTFERFNLPAGTTWGVSIGSAYYFTNATELNVSLPANAYYWYSVNTISLGVAGVQYVTPGYYGYISAPYSTFQAIVYQEQFQVAFAAGGTTGGSVIPSAGTYWLNAGSMVAISAVNGTSVHFKSWSATTTTGTLPIATTSTPSTVLTVSGTGTVTAKFA